MAMVLREQLIRRVIREQSCQTYCSLLSQWEFCHRLHWSQRFIQATCYSAALSLLSGLTSATMTWFGNEETTGVQVPVSNIKFSSSLLHMAWDPFQHECLSLWLSSAQDSLRNFARSALSRTVSKIVIQIFPWILECKISWSCFWKRRVNKCQN